MVFIAAFLAVLTKGSGTIQTNFGIPKSMADVLTGIILFFMLGCEFFINYRLIFRGKGGGAPWVISIWQASSPPLSWRACPFSSVHWAKFSPRNPGNLNLGVEGMMFMGAVGGLAGPYFYEQAGGTSQIVAVLLGLALAFLCAAFGAFLTVCSTITLRDNQNVTGLALTIFGTGFANFFGEAIGSTNASNYMSVGKPTVDAFNNGIMGSKGRRRRGGISLRP